MVILHRLIRAKVDLVDEEFWRKGERSIMVRWLVVCGLWVCSDFCPVCYAWTDGNWGDGRIGLQYTVASFQRVQNWADSRNEYQR